MIKPRSGQTLDGPSLTVFPVAASSNELYCKINMLMSSRNQVGLGKKETALEVGKARWETLLDELCVAFGREAL